MLLFFSEIRIGIEIPEEWFLSAVQPTLADLSDGGQLITESELQDIKSSVLLPEEISSDMVDKFVTRFNKTIHSWDNGVMEDDSIISYSQFTGIIQKIENNTAKAEQEGYTGIPEWFDAGMEEFKQADDDKEGVCAKVRIQILQKLAITREAFRARLELENGETDKLTNIRVEIKINDGVPKNYSNHLFAIGSISHYKVNKFMFIISYFKSLSDCIGGNILTVFLGMAETLGITNIDGSGELPVETSGSAEWIIIPYSEAAPFDEQLYEIGGTLYYTVYGKNITIPLYPDTVTVKPDPQLHLNYFLERYVKADDALTEGGYISNLYL